MKVTIKAIAGITLVLGIHLLARAQGNTDFNHIFSASFEGISDINTSLDTNLAAGSSVSSDGVGITSVDDEPSIVSISSAVDENFDEIKLVQIQGGNTQIDVSALIADQPIALSGELFSFSSLCILN